MRLGFSIVERVRVRVGVGEIVCAGAMAAQKSPYKPDTSPYELRSEPCTGSLERQKVRRTQLVMFSPCEPCTGRAVFLRAVYLLKLDYRLKTDMGIETDKVINTLAA
jgi:hypothetical protein